jgi:membrane fusion protein, multidrug efflux system
MKASLQIILTGLVLLALGCSPAKAPSEKTSTSTETKITATVVETTSPTMVKKDQRISAAGILSADVESRLAFKTGGIVKQVLVENGEEVKAGQLLAELNLTEINAAATQAREGLRKAERDFARAQSLYAQDVIAKAQLDDAKTALDVARAGNVAGQFNAGVGRLLAPKAGKVIRRFVEANEVVAPGAPVLAFAQNGGEKLLKIALSDVDAVRVNVGDEAVVQFDALPNQSFPARVRTLPGGANPATGLFEVEIAIDGDLGRLTSGAVGRALIQAAELTTDSNDASNSALSVPIAALVEANADQALVYVVENNQPSPRVRARVIRIGSIQGAFVTVLDGLTLSDQIVVRGASYLEDNLPIVIAKTPSLAAAERANVP